MDITKPQDKVQKPIDLILERSQSEIKSRQTSRGSVIIPQSSKALRKSKVLKEESKLRSRELKVIFQLTETYL
jgi:hypothetical protein